MLIDDSTASMQKTAPVIAPIAAPRKIPHSVAKPIRKPRTIPTTEPTAWNKKTKTRKKENEKGKFDSASKTNSLYIKYQLIIVKNNINWKNNTTTTTFKHV